MRLRALRAEISHGASCVEVPFILFSSSPVTERCWRYEG
nr:MAG TPA: Regulatory protein E2 beta-barrel, DNA binding protein [Caudoviricetes sp.]